MNWFTSIIALVFAVFVVVKSEPESRHSGRQGRLFPIFQIVRFANDPCIGGSKNGTCYTPQECESRNGVNSGSCASGYGVCCVFNINCGETSSENCTYFESNTVAAGGCAASICPCSSNICQLRLDFENFVITGPVTASTAEILLKTTNGLSTPMAGVPVSLQSQCLTDTFQVVGGGGVSNSDVICGTNTGEHLYVEAEEANECNQLTFQFGQAGFDSQAVTTRQWSIKVTQYSCNFRNLAPPGCTQWFFGSNVGSVRTFNFNGGQHLANQDQTICVRRETTNCRICWYAAIATDFQVSGLATMAAPGQGFLLGTACCSYGKDGMQTKGYDCVNIPGAEKAGATNAMTASLFCGRSNGLVTKSVDSMAPPTGTPNTNSKTICSRRTPFYLRFRSDNFEFSMVEGKTANVGAQLSYFMDAINCA